MSGNAQTRRASVSPASFAHVLVALDGSPFAEQILPTAVGFAKTAGARLTLVTAVPAAEQLIAQHATAFAVAAPRVDVVALADEARAGAERYLAEVTARLGADVSYQVLLGDPKESIPRFATDEHADLIAMTTHGRTGVGRVVFGSTAEAIVRNSPCPVLLEHVREARRD